MTAATPWVLLGGVLLAALLVSAGGWVLAERRRLRLLALAHDEELARSREALRQSDERLRLALDGGSDGLWDWPDVSLPSGWWSPQFYRLLGREPQSHVADTSLFLEWVHPQDRAQLQTNLRRAVSEDSRYESEFRVRMPDGCYRWFRSRAQARREGHRVHMAGSLQDIDELKRAQAELADIFAASPDAYMAFAADGRLRYASPALTQLCPALAEVSFELELGAWLMQLQKLHGDPDRAPPPAQVGEPVLFHQLRPLPRVLQLQCHHGRGDSGIQTLVQMRDVSAEMAVDALKSEFISTAAHELRTPMATIYGYVELLLHRDMPAERARGYLQKVHRQCAAVVGITNDLLDLARIESRGRVDLERVRMDLRALVEQALADWEPAEGRAAPQLQLGQRPLLVHVDLALMKKVLRALLSNAYKFSEDAVWVEVLERRGCAAVAIRDRGIGMDAQALARAGERFWRADPSGARLGAGLGLAIARELCQLMDGVVELESQPGQGTTAWVLLPQAT